MTAIREGLVGREGAFLMRCEKGSKVVSGKNGVLVVVDVVKGRRRPGESQDESGRI